jgi:hypothetical protein
VHKDGLMQVQDPGERELKRASNAGKPSPFASEVMSHTVI